MTETIKIDTSEILKPLLEKGDLKRSIELAAKEGLELLEVRHNGLNFVTASILADVPTVKKTGLIKKTGDMFSAQEYCDLLNEKIFTIHPRERDQLKRQKVQLNTENSVQYSNWYNLFDIAFPWLPLSIFEDLMTYLTDEKTLELDKENIDLVRTNFEESKKYSMRELDNFFNLPIFKDLEDE